MAKGNKKTQDTQPLECTPEQELPEGNHELGAPSQERREFLQKAGMGLAALAVTAALPSTVLGATLSEQEVKALADKVTNVSALGFQCPQMYCPQDHDMCVGFPYFFCKVQHCTDDFCLNSYGCSGGTLYCEGTWCSSDNCEVGWEQWCQTTKTPCDQHYCRQDGFCQTKYCYNGDANCSPRHCLGYYCPTNFCQLNDAVDDCFGLHCDNGWTIC